jgi:acyl-coenzyme A thioesterase PaaI-like protein
LAVAELLDTDGWAKLCTARSLNEQLWSDYQRCFACGQENQIGLQLELYECAGAVVSRWEPRPEYENWYGIVHGGVLTVALDELGGTAAWLAFRRRGDEFALLVTAELTVSFRAPVRIGRVLDCSARVIEIGDRSALVEANLGAEGTVCTSMVGRYVKPSVAPRRHK